MFDTVNFMIKAGVFTYIIHLGSVVVEFNCLVRIEEIIIDILLLCVAVIDPKCTLSPSPTVAYCLSPETCNRFY